MTDRIPVLLFVIYLALFTVCAIEPFDRAAWWAENIPIMLIVGILAVTYRWYQFTPTSYLLMACLVYLHTIGGHYTFAFVPFGFVTDLFGFERNHYDRMAHFTVGFYAFAIAEFILAKSMVRSRLVLYLFPFCAILSVAALYEIIEWWFALYVDPDAGPAVLGSQGDVWDAQKDMLADGLGAITAMILFRVINRDKLQALPL